MYNPETNQIRIDIPVGTPGRDAILRWIPTTLYHDKNATPIFLFESAAHVAYYFIAINDSEYILSITPVTSFGKPDVFTARRFIKELPWLKRNIVYVLLTKCPENKSAQKLAAHLIMAGFDRPSTRKENQ